MKGSKGKGKPKKLKLPKSPPILTVNREEAQIAADVPSRDVPRPYDDVSVTWKWDDGRFMTVPIWRWTRLDARIGSIAILLIKLIEFATDAERVPTGMTIHLDAQDETLRVDFRYGA